MQRSMTLLVAACLALSACGQPSRSTNRAERDKVRATPVVLSATPDPAVTELNLSVQGGSCGADSNVTRLDHAEVRETESAVTVTAFTYVANPLPESAVCGGVGLIIPVPVRLSWPLGNRDLLDGSCQPPVPVRLLGESRPECQAPPPKSDEPERAGHWKAVDAGPLVTRGEPKGVWTGKEVIVVGGLIIDQYQALSDGAAFDPATGRWRRIANRPAAGRILRAVWTGRELFTYGSDGIGLETLTTAFAYNPATDRWRQVSLPPSTKVPHAVVWTGQRVLAWQPGLAAPGAIYDPATDWWSPIPANSVPGAVSAGAAVWTGHELAVEGAVTPQNGGPAEQRLFLFDPVRLAWRASTKPPTDLSMWPFLVPASAAGRVIIGGTPANIPANSSSGSQRPKASTLVYDPTGDRWDSVPSPFEQAPPAFDVLEGDLLVQGTGAALPLRRPGPTLVDHRSASRAVGGRRDDRLHRQGGSGVRDHHQRHVRAGPVTQRCLSLEPMTPCGTSPCSLHPSRHIDRLRYVRDATVRGEAS
jgi:hypothetical protein